MPDCPRCAAHDAALPLDRQLRAMFADDFDEATQEWMPVARTVEQTAAADILARALAIYAKQFGAKNTAARLVLSAAVYRIAAKQHAIMCRQLEARQEINEHARELEMAGDLVGAAEETQKPTPDYDGKDRDDRWLKERGLAL